MNKAAVRRALTTLKKQGLFYEVILNNPFHKGKVYISILVDAELTMPKKKIRIKNARKRNIQN